jgi:hypothetical protein
MIDIENRELRVEMIKKKAEIVFFNASPIVGSFYVSRQAATHKGSETVLEILNSNKKYLPFETKENDIVLLQKGGVMMVILEDSEIGEKAPFLQGISAEVFFISGDPIMGKVYSDLPKSHSRLSDFLNLSEVFFHLEVEDNDYLVNSQFVKFVRQA